MNHDDIRAAADRPFRQVGLGQHSLWRCMGCHQNREAAGSKGVGIRRRCAQCVAKKEAKR